MSITVESAAAPMDIRALHERMGRVYHQPVRVHSFTNKHFTVNFRVPLEQLRRIVPEPIELDEIGGTGLGMLSMCACDFWVSRLGLAPHPAGAEQRHALPGQHQGPQGGQGLPHLLHPPLGLVVAVPRFFGSRFSHFRKQVSPFVRVDDGARYSLECRAADPLCRGKFAAVMASVTKEKPDTTVFADVEEAKQFVFDLDGSCGYSYERDMLSFQKIDYPPWDMYFCHEYRYEFPLMDYVYATFGLDAELDCVLFMQDTEADLGLILAVPQLTAIPI